MGRTRRADRRRPAHPAPLVVALMLAAGCGRGPARVSFENERCSLDGRTATIEEVELEQARLSERVLNRAPLQTAITLAVVLFGVGTNLGKLGALLGVDHERARSTLRERLRAVVDRRKHPRRYVAITSLSLASVVAAGAVYLYLDADKRASERALAQLQFCHLALKSAAEQSSLDEQRKNLDALQGTASSIKQLVDGLPPEEQRKAEVLLAQMRSALGNQQRLLSHEDAVAQAVQAESASLRKELAAVQGALGALGPVPSHIEQVAAELGKVEARTRLSPDGKAPATLGDALGEVTRQVAAVGEHVGQIDCAKAKLPSGKTVGEALAEIASRPPPSCRCECPPAPAPHDGGR